MKRVALVFALALAAACGDDAATTTTVADAGAPDASDAGTSPADASVPLCSNGQPSSAWPPGPYGMDLGSTLPPGLVFGDVALADYYEPCASQSRLLVIRSAGAWCGTCGWHATHTTRLFGDPKYAARVRLVDLLVSDEDNLPPDDKALARWRARIDVPNGLDFRIGIDAKYTFQATVVGQFALLPEYVLVDTRTMTALNVQSDPPPEQLLSFLDLELAQLDGRDRPPIQAPALTDGLFSEDQWDVIKDITTPGAPPADPTNEFADAPAAVTLGQALYNDLALSPSGRVACVTCHDPTKAFGDGIPIAEGVSRGDRNSPNIALAAHSRWQFWDGRADTLWAQAAAPFENAREIASSRLFVAHGIADRHAADYAAAFGAKYPLPDLSALPAAGKPGDAAYDALTQTQRDDVTRVLVNASKAIAAFERSFRVAPNALDRYAAGDFTALTADQKQGLESFAVSGCIQCHYGPRLTDDAFHAIRFPTGRTDAAPDRGRADVLLGLAASEFAASSKWSDAPSAAKPLVFTTVPDSMLGAFKTPSLRGVPASAPYGHGGVFTSFADIVNHYGKRGDEIGPNQAVGTTEPWVPHFDSVTQAKLADILDVLTAESP